ncbi:MAG: hypothetical protein AB3N22_17975 [Ruegeria sp.]
MRVVLHIGLNKTGTCSVQNVLFANPEALAREGWLYPKAALERSAHHALVGIAAQGMGALRAFRADITAEAQDAGLDQIVISTEALHETPHIGRLARLFEDCETRILLTLRDPVDYLSSWYREDVKSTGLCSDFATYAVLKRKTFLPLLRAWARAFGRDALILRVYDRARLFRGSSVDDAMQAGLGIHDMTGWRPAEVAENPSVSGNLLFYKRLLNNFISREEATVYRDELRLLSIAEPAFRQPLEIPEAFVRYLINQFYKADAAAIKEEFDVDLNLNTNGRPGVVMPDLDRLAQDFRTIQTASAEQGLRFGARLAPFVPALVPQG